MQGLKIIIFILLPFFSQAQFNSPYRLTLTDSIVVRISDQHGKIYQHKLKAKETIYSLCRNFGVKPSDIQDANPYVNINKTQIGQNISIPFTSDILIKENTQLNPALVYVPVYYQVMPKDNLYRISRVYFNQTIENLLEINQMKSIDLKIGQIIQVGWLATNLPETPSEEPEIQLPTSSIAEAMEPSEKKQETLAIEEKIVPQKESESTEKKKFRIKNLFKKKSENQMDDRKEVVMLSEQLEQNEKFEEPGERKKKFEKEGKLTLESTIQNEENALEDQSSKIESTAMDSSFIESLVQYRSQKGIAIWNQRSRDTKKLFALHPTAKVGSYIEITNPMLGTTVQAKVVGNIPPRTYTDDVSIVVSPRVAKMLGAMDRRFKVKMKYIE